MNPAKWVHAIVDAPWWLYFSGSATAWVALAAMNSKYAVALGMAYASVPFRNAVGLVAFATTAVWITNAAHGAVRWGLDRRDRTQKLDLAIKGLTTDEIFFLRLCTHNNAKTIPAAMTNFLVASLRDKGLLKVASSGSILAMPHTFPDDVWGDMVRAAADNPPAPDVRTALDSTSIGDYLETVQRCAMGWDSIPRLRR